MQKDKRPICPPNKGVHPIVWGTKAQVDTSKGWWSFGQVAKCLCLPTNPWRHRDCSNQLSPSVWAQGGSRYKGGIPNKGGGVIILSSVFNAKFQQKVVSWQSLPLFQVGVLCLIFIGFLIEFEYFWGAPLEFGVENEKSWMGNETWSWSL